MPCLPVPICIRWRLPVENFPQHKSRGEVCPFTEKEAANQRKKAYLSKDKPCILKKRLNGVLDQNIGLIIQRFLRYSPQNMPAIEIIILINAFENDIILA